jgi:hypothetical protein
MAAILTPLLYMPIRFQTKSIITLMGAEKRSRSGGTENRNP